MHDTGAFSLESILETRFSCTDPSKGAAATVPDASKTWTPEEQKLLEQALKTYSSTLADRWDRIASCVPSRSKKECMARFKVHQRSILLLSLFVHGITVSLSLNRN